MPATARTTLGGIGCIRTCGCAAIGPLARNRASDPSGSAVSQSPKQATGLQSPKTMSEAEAIRLAQGGDAAAFEFLYRLHGRRVYALCLRMVGNPSDAEDLMQEAFLQLFRKIGTFRGESAFSTWLHRMTVNVVLMQLRKKGLPVVSLEETLEADDEAPRKEFGTKDLKLTGSIDRLQLQRAIDRLPPGYRTVFVLHDVEGFEHNEIAQIVGCSIGNSKSQLHKARLKLRDYLKFMRAEKAKTG